MTSQPMDGSPQAPVGVRMQVRQDRVRQLGRVRARQQVVGSINHDAGAARECAHPRRVGERELQGHDAAVGIAHETLRASSTCSASSAPGATARAAITPTS
jgi:hypothetical protein